MSIRTGVLVSLTYPLGAAGGGGSRRVQRGRRRRTPHPRVVRSRVGRADGRRDRLRAPRRPRVVRRARGIRLRRGGLDVVATEGGDQRVGAVPDRVGSRGLGDRPLRGRSGGTTGPRRDPSFGPRHGDWVCRWRGPLPGRDVRAEPHDANALGDLFVAERAHDAEAPLLDANFIRRVWSRQGFDAARSAWAAVDGPGSSWRTARRASTSRA
jgi:hypothetical protein